MSSAKTVVLFAAVFLLLRCGGGGSGGESDPSIRQESTPALGAFWAGEASFIEDELLFGDTFGMHFLSALWNEDTLFAYYVKTEWRRGEEVSSTYLAKSSDGIAFTNVGRVLEAMPPTERIASFASVWRERDTWYMAFEGAPAGQVSGSGGIYAATSSDGVKWEQHQEPLLVPSADWESVNIGTPTLFKEGSRWYLFYHGYDGERLNIGLASGTDFFDLRHENNHLPVLEVGSGWDAGTVGKRSIIKQGSWYYMAYEGSTAPTLEAGFHGARWSTGLARSKDLIHWEKYPQNPILPQTVTGFGFDGPELIRTPDDRLHLYFRNPSGTTSRATLSSR